MGRAVTPTRSRRDFVAGIVVGYLGGTLFLVGGLLVLAGVVTVAGWGAGTLVQRITVGALAVVWGLAVLAGATMEWAGGRTASPSRGPTTRVARRGPFWAGIHAEAGHTEAGFGISTPPKRHGDVPEL